MPTEELPSAKGKGTAGKVFQWIVTVGLALSTINTYVNPEFLAQAADKAFITKEVEDKYAHSELRRRDSVFIAEEFKKIYNKLRVNRNVTNTNQLLLVKNKQTIDSNTKHTDFNTQGISIISDLTTEMMERKKDACDWVYYKTHEGDNWKVFPDVYHSRIPYSLDLRSNCRAYYTPINGSKTKAN